MSSVFLRFFLKVENDRLRRLNYLPEAHGMTIGGVAALEDANKIAKVAAPSLKRVWSFVYVA